MQIHSASFFIAGRHFVLSGLIFAAGWSPVGAGAEPKAEGTCTAAQCEVPSPQTSPPKADPVNNPFPPDLSAQKLSERGGEALPEFERLMQSIDLELAHAEKDPAKSDASLLPELRAAQNKLSTILPGLRSIQEYLGLHAKYVNEVQRIDRILAAEKDPERKTMLETERRAVIERDLSIPSPVTQYSPDNLKHDVEWLERGELYDLLSKVKTSREDAVYAALQTEEAELALARAATPPSLLTASPVDPEGVAAEAAPDTSVEMRTPASPAPATK